MEQTGTQVVVRPDNSVGVKATEIRSPGRGEVLVETVSTLISAGTELGTQEQGRSVKGWKVTKSATVCCRWGTTQVMSLCLLHHSR